MISPIQAGLRHLLLASCLIFNYFTLQVVMSFRNRAMENRHLLLLSLSIINKQNGMGPAGTAYELGQQCYKRGLCDEVKEPKGGLYDSWIRSKKIPAWAARTAAAMLLDIPEYLPRTEDELCALLLMLVEAHDMETIDQLSATLPERFDVDTELLRQAVSSKKASYN